MMPDPLFTVILTTYSRRDLLPRAMQSVLSQTFPDFELLVIDDHSRDDTAHIVQQIRDSRVRYVLTPQRMGSCDGSRNVGIQMARAPLTAILDDDDIWYPERLQQVQRAFNQHPDVGIVCHYENRRVSGRLDGVLRHGPWSEHFYERLLYEGNLLSPCATTIQTELLRQFGGFDLRKEFDAAADYDLWLRMAAQGVKVHYIEKPLGEFSVTGNNWSTVDPAFEARVACLVQTHLLQHEQQPLLRLSNRGLRRLFQLYCIAGRALQRAGGYREALKWYLNAVGCMIIRPSIAGDVLSRVAGKARGNEEE